MHQYGTGRPDAQDKAELEKIRPPDSRTPAPGSRLQQQCSGVRSGAARQPPPTGNTKAFRSSRRLAKPVLAAVPAPKHVPWARSRTATPEQTDKNRCISCMRCIQIRPVKARSLNKAVLSVAGCSMKKVCSGRKRMNYI